MKKIHEVFHLIKIPDKKILRIMKIAVLLSLFGVLSSYAGVFSQDTRINVNIEQGTLNDLFVQIEKQTEFKIFYKTDLVDPSILLSLKAEDKTVREILQMVLPEQNLSYDQVGKVIVITAMNSGNQRQNIITGTVTDASKGEALVGVNVVVEGTTLGVVTDLNGNYQMELPANGAVLIFSYVGYNTERIEIAGRSRIDIALIPDIMALDEVVVVGYGVMKERDVTGSISTIRNENIGMQKTSSLDAALQGMSSGLQVSQASGTPGGTVRVMIRGTKSVNSGTEPLYIIDGVPIEQEITGMGLVQSGADNSTAQSPLASINPSDIEQISILKDAVATAIYGSRGANGVIIVTTKSGQKGKGRFSASYTTGLVTPVKILEFVNTSQWFEMFDQSQLNALAPGSFAPYSYVPETYKYANGESAYWSRLSAEHTDINHLRNYLNVGSLQEFNLNASNGNDRGNYFLSFNYRDEKGIATGNRFKRYNLRSNVDFNLNDWIKVGTHLGLSYIDNNLPINGNSTALDVGGKNDKGTLGGFWSANLEALPMFPIYDPKGMYFDPLSGRNIVASTDRDHIRDNLLQYRLLGNAYLELKPFRNLLIRAELGTDFLDNDQIIWMSGMLRTISGNPSPLAYNEKHIYRTMNYVAYATYSKQLGDIHDLSVTLGCEGTDYFVRWNHIRAENLTSKDQELGEFQEGVMDNVLSLLSGVQEHKKRATPVLSRINYKLLDRYILGWSFRRDASSVFPAHNRWNNFMAGSAAWIVSAEPFMEKFPDMLSFLKLRGSFGVAGNDKISSGLDIDRYSTWPTYGGAIGFTLENIGNKQLGWEKSYQLDVALEFGLFKNRVSGSLGLYNIITRDMLLQTPIPYSVGVAMSDLATINIGDMRNNGVEMELTTYNIQRQKFKWNTSFNFTTNHNEILALSPALEENPRGHEQGITVTRKGNTLGCYFLPEYAGLDEEGYETIFEIDQDLLDQGIYKKTGNKIRATTTNVANNKLPLTGKSGIPTFYGGMTNSFQFKGFELSFIVSWQGGNYLYDDAERQLSYVFSGNNNMLKKVYNHTWTPENPQASYPMLRYGNVQSPETDNGGGALSTETSRYLYKGDFLKLRNINLNYTVPEIISNRLKVHSIRLFFSVQNVLTWSPDYNGYDPEFVRLGSSPERNLLSGTINRYSIPFVRTFTGGVNLDF